MKAPRAPWSLLAVLLVFLGTLYMALSKPPRNVLSWDVYGYYLYLPQTFIRHDPTLHEVDSTLAIMHKYKLSGTFYQAERLPDSKDHVMKYPMGMAVLYAPFFAIGHQVAKWQGHPQDGFSPPYHRAIHIGCILYGLLGLVFFRQLLRRYFPDGWAALVIVAITYGTNYFVHVMSSANMTMSHGPLFMLYALIGLQVARWHERQRWADIIVLGLACGMAILVRATEGLCLLIPLLWGISDRESLAAKLRLMARHWPQVAAFALLAFLAVSPQLIYWKLVTGSFLFNGYSGNPGEGLDLHKPHLLEVLFSFRKGWLLYTPQAVLSIAGLYIAWRKRHPAGLALLIYLAINVYVISCWTTWWYGPSFSQRPLVPTQALLAIGLGFFVQWAWEKRSAIRWAALTLLALTVALNLWQSRQFRKSIIDQDRMTGKVYKRGFFAMNKDAAWERVLLPWRAGPGGDSIPFIQEYTSRAFRVLDAEADVPFTDTLHAHSGRRSQRIDQANPYSMGFAPRYDEITTRDHAWLRFSAYVWPEDQAAIDGLRLVAHFEHEGKAFHYNSRKPKPGSLKIGQWNLVEFLYQTAEIRDPSDNLKTFFWMTKPGTAWIDDFRIQVMERP